MKVIAKRILNKIASRSIVQKANSYVGRVVNYVNNESNDSFRIEMAKRLQPSNILEAGLNVKIGVDGYDIYDSKGRIKVRLFHQQANMWNSVASLYEELLKDNRLQPVVVLTGTHQDIGRLVDQMDRSGYSYVLTDKYDITVDLPDISIIYHPIAFAGLPESLKHMRRYSKMVISIPIMVKLSFATPEEFIWNLHNNELKPDYCLLDKMVYRIISPRDVSYERYIEMGNPKFDSVFHMLETEVEYPLGWKKLNGKTVVMWATDHGISLNSVYPDVAFDIYAKDFFSYFSDKPDMALVFRPHSTYINELIKTFWSLADLNKIIRFCAESPNIVWDDTDDYSLGYKLADAIVTDVNCDVIISALATKKPIAVLWRNDISVKSFNPHITESYYNIHSPKELMKYLDDIRAGKDEMYQQRMELIRSTMKDFDGKNGRRIKMFILDEYFRRCV
jgi:metal-responsive CopG/Arc/MetJ family transcriptional regulator